jgi:hypothetical protein
MMDLALNSILYLFLLMLFLDVCLTILLILLDMFE